MTALNTHTNPQVILQSTAASSSSSQGPAPILDSLTVLNTGSNATTRHQSSNNEASRDSSATTAAAMSLSHVLSGLQEGDLTEVLQDHPNLSHGLNTIALGDVSSDPESLRFQFQPSEELLQHSSSAPKKKGRSVYREQDRFLPLHNVARVMRNAIPSNGKVSKDAKECMQECVSECISFITSEASDKCIAEKRKTITGDDILCAMATLGFDNYIEPLRLYLQKYREYSRAEKINSNTDCTSDHP